MGTNQIGQQLINRNKTHMSQIQVNFMNGNIQETRFYFSNFKILFLKETLKV